MSVLYTDRLTLRPFRETDARAVFENWTADERVARYCRWYPHQSLQETEAYLSHCLTDAFCWAITLSGTDEPIGCVSVVGTDSAGVPELGYVLSYRCWGRGIMTEAVRAVIAELFRCGYEKLRALHSVANPASGKVMQKCGMHYVGTGMTQKKFGSEELEQVNYYEIAR
ncbi:MAG: GNAT family N-acetyltransferase [Clostridiales bacterium]|nr:GNAT family N-acetyltransferase [Clostridiales bacterium]